MADSLDFVGRMTFLEWLDIEQVGLTDAELISLRRRLPDTKIVYSSSCLGCIWRSKNTSLRDHPWVTHALRTGRRFLPNATYIGPERSEVWYWHVDGSGKSTTMGKVESSVPSLRDPTRDFEEI